MACYWSYDPTLENGEELCIGMCFSFLFSGTTKTIGQGRKMYRNKNYLSRDLNDLKEFPSVENNWLEILMFFFFFRAIKVID